MNKPLNIPAGHYESASNYYTLADASKITDINREALYSRIKRNALPAVRFRGKICLTTNTIEKLLKEQNYNKIDKYLYIHIINGSFYKDCLQSTAPRIRKDLEESHNLNIFGRRLEAALKSLRYVFNHFSIYNDYHGCKYLGDNVDRDQRLDCMIALCNEWLNLENCLRDLMSLFRPYSPGFVNLIQETHLRIRSAKGSVGSSAFTSGFVRALETLGIDMYNTLKGSGNLPNPCDRLPNYSDTLNDINKRLIKSIEEEDNTHKGALSNWGYWLKNNPHKEIALELKEALRIGSPVQSSNSRSLSSIFYIDSDKDDLADREELS